MRGGKIVWLINRGLLIGAVPIGAVVWLFANLGWGLFAAIAAILVGAAIYSVTPPLLQSRPGKSDADDLSTAPILGGRGMLEEQRLTQKPLRYRRDSYEPGDDPLRYDGR
jgi:membrane protein implicated in regulation of membrane protease activity